MEGFFHKHKKNPEEAIEAASVADADRGSPEVPPLLPGSHIGEAASAAKIARGYPKKKRHK